MRVFKSPVFFRFKSIILALIVVPWVTSCYNDPELIGKSLLPDDDLYSIKVDTSFKVSAYTVTLDSLFTYGSTYAIMGCVKNDVFGLTKSEFAFEVGVGNYKYFKENAFQKFPTPDSAFISFKLYDRFPASTSPLTFRLFELKDSLSTQNGFDSMEGKYHLYQISSTTYSGDSILKFYLPPVYTQNILRADSSVFMKDSTFKKFIKGYYITCDNLTSTGGAINRFLISTTKAGIGYYIYFHNVLNDSLTYKLAVNSSQPHANVIKHDYSLASAGSKIHNLNDTINQDSVFYLQGLGGVRGMLKLNDVAAWIQKMPVAIHKAELRIQMENNSNMPSDSSIKTIYFNMGRTYGYNSSTGLYYKPIYDYYISKVDYSSYFKPRKYYSFDITYQLQQLIKGKITQNSIYIEPESFTNSYSQTVLRSGRHSHPIKLIITYTKLN